jgi:hypothetical protein
MLQVVGMKLGAILKISSERDAQLRMCQCLQFRLKGRGRVVGFSVE